MKETGLMLGLKERLNVDQVRGKCWAHKPTHDRLQGDSK